VEEGGSIRRNCVADGPFKNLRPTYYGPNKEEHCLARNWNSGGNTVGDMMAFAYTNAVVERIQGLETFQEYASDLEARPHGAVHVGISGDMMPSTSPNGKKLSQKVLQERMLTKAADPIFFLHHAQVDRLWYLWQQKNPSVREADYSGNRTPNLWDGTTPPPASLSDFMHFRGLSSSLRVQDVMSTKTSRLCYEY
jgi:tyrosinase